MCTEGIIYMSIVRAFDILFPITWFPRKWYVHGSNLYITKGTNLFSTDDTTYTFGLHGIKPLMAFSKFLNLPEIVMMELLCFWCQK